MRNRSGQATVEYIALLLFLSCILTVAGAAAFAPGIVNATVRSIRYAICVVSGDQCERPKNEPCVTRSKAVRDHVGGTLLFVKVERDHILLVERLSDGSIAITVIDKIDGGGELDLGIRAALGSKSKNIALTASLRAALLAEVGHARTYIAANEREANEMINRLGEDSNLRWLTAPFHLVQSIQGVGPYPPDVIYIQAGLVADGSVNAALFKGKLGLDLGSEQIAGVRFDRRSGEKTIYLRNDADILAQFNLLFASSAFSAARAVALSVVVDDDGVPQKLVLLGAAQAGKGKDSDNQKGTQLEVEATLDLHDAENKAAFARVLDAWRRPGKATLNLPASMLALAKRFREHARLDYRRYEKESKTNGIGGSLKLGVGISGAVERSQDNLTLVDASSKPDGGLWERRDDCLQRAHPT